MRYLEALVIEYDWRGEPLWTPLLTTLRSLVRWLLFVRS